MGRNPQQNELIRKKRIAQILQAGLDIYLRVGIHQMEMSDVAVRAEIGKGTLYHYYKNKYDLLKDVFHNRIREASTLCRAHLVTEGTSDVQRIEAYFRAILEAVQANPLLGSFYKHFEEDSRLVFADDREEFLLSYKTEVFQPLYDAFKGAIDSGELRTALPLPICIRMIWGALIGMMTLFTSTHDWESDPDKYNNACIALLFEGLLPRA